MMGLKAVKDQRSAVPGKTATFTIRGETICVVRHAKLNPSFVAELRETAARQFLGLSGWIGLDCYSMLSPGERAGLALPTFRPEFSEITP